MFFVKKRIEKRFTGLSEVCNAAKQTPKHTYKKIKNKHLVKGHDKNNVIIFGEKKHLHENKTKQNEQAMEGKGECTIFFI